MAETTKRPAQPPPEDLPWAISVVRDDLKETRSELRLVG